MDSVGLLITHNGPFLFHGYNYRIRLIRNTFKKINIHGLFFYANLAFNTSFK